MPDYPFYQIDAFASKTFEGNQACVMPMDAFLDDEILQSIAAENNVAETAFIVAAGQGVWDLRWFTPAIEVPLCGHATLAAAHVLFSHLGVDGDTLSFRTRRSGTLHVSRTSAGYLMDFPASPLHRMDVTDKMEAALGVRPIEAWGGSFLACVFETMDQVMSLTPDHRLLSELGAEASDWERGNVGCVCAGGHEGADVVSRFFAPGSGIDEDPATGAWHCMVAPLMSEKLGRTSLRCFQAFPGRGAWIETRLEGVRVQLGGEAVTVIEGVFHLA